MSCRRGHAAASAVAGAPVATFRLPIPRDSAPPAGDGLLSLVHRRDRPDGRRLFEPARPPMTRPVIAYKSDPVRGAVWHEIFTREAPDLRLVDWTPEGEAAEAPY